MNKTLLLAADRFVCEALCKRRTQHASSVSRDIHTLINHGKLGNGEVKVHQVMSYVFTEMCRNMIKMPLAILV